MTQVLDRGGLIRPKGEIEVNGLTKIYPGDVEAVKGIDFRVGVGEAFGLLGPNGAGKSTTIGMLATTVLPTNGSATLAGFDIVTEPIGARSVSAVVFQDPAVDRTLTGRRNLEIHAQLWGVRRPALRNRIDEVVEALGLAEYVDRPAGDLSGGQRRRLEIARALISEPGVLFLDEPTIGLDPRIRRELLDLIGQLKERREMTVFVTTHYLDEAQQLCDRVAIMHQGRIVAMGTPTDLQAALGSELVELHVNGDPSSVLANLHLRGHTSDDAFIVGTTIIIPVHEGSATEVIASASALRLAVAEIAARPPTLEDVFLQLTGDRLTD